MTAVGALFIILLAQTQNCFGQGNKSDSLLNEFRKDVQIELKKYGKAGMNDNETKKSYYLLMLHSSVDDLARYTNDTSAFIRTAMFAGLLRKKVKDNLLIKILEEHKNDTATFSSLAVDVVTTWRVNEFMQAGMKLRSDNELPKINYKKEIENIHRTPKEVKIEGIHHGYVDKQELVKLDSLLLTTHKLRIISFTLFVEGETFKSSSNMLTNEMKTAIKRLESTSMISFSDIKVVSHDHKVYKLASLVLKLN